MSERHWCCETMRSQLTYKCEIHSDTMDCPDIIVTYWPKYDEYGIPIRNGGSSIMTIGFCPWCGTRLPESKRQHWFDELEQLGFEDPLEQAIPEEYTTDLWWRNKPEQQSVGYASA